MYLFDDPTTTNTLDFWQKEITRYLDIATPRYLLGVGEKFQKSVYEKANEFAAESLFTHQYIELTELKNCVNFIKEIIDAKVQPLPQKNITDEKTTNSCCVIL
ncbi:hypothetical protein EIN_086090 [Entamoeba invadens IP1]|uniref:hypothetical protein n=1 Tax=Entamoeba invadens IP1 TaxID=370355 RepID=UPI0002C3CFAB|nr:hypothetical protein EIN_086090 [Entamoeba invadens IP1]ELP85357.1 hypothetical protein EIN_086090 [Entamoeba invadens IP1]|eukprot:XP_004184703.1 hypothetical protein EIN_086090 [Entamoeba invadens IP1]